MVRPTRRIRLIPHREATQTYAAVDPARRRHADEAPQTPPVTRVTPLPAEVYSFSPVRFQRIPASMKPSMSPSNTADGLPVSYSVRRSLTIWYGFNTYERI